MSKRPKWAAKLTKNEWQHILKTTLRAHLRSFKRNRDYHRSEVAKGKTDPCTECRIIAKKLGLE